MSVDLQCLLATTGSACARLRMLSRVIGWQALVVCHITRTKGLGHFHAHCGFPAEQSHRSLVEQDDL